ncbi:MAG: GNAT family N-acetyltransferase [Candidatus Staskawiczbacteria bacterium]|nr:GNAT family N-acetyltransferase [Candidatus Staskawiczbacteria bacterium]
MKIRNLKKEDINQCLKIVLETEASSSKKEAKKVMEYSLAPGIKPLNPNYYVLVLDNKIIGVSGLYYDYEDPKDIMWMDYFAVSPKFQRRGYGTEMLNNLTGICEKKKVRMLCVFTDKDGALAFYQNNGFKIAGKIENYYDQKPRIWLYKNLK